VQLMSQKEWGKQRGKSIDSRQVTRKYRINYFFPCLHRIQKQTFGKREHRSVQFDLDKRSNWTHFILKFESNWKTSSNWTIRLSSRK
jgi:hypothetical protein